MQKFLHQALRIAAGLAAVCWMGVSAQAQAQSFPSIAPPPVHETVDANGVDLIQGLYNFKEPSLSIGTPGNGLSRSVVLGVDNYVGTINYSGLDYYVSYAGGTEHFTRNGTVYSNASGTASTFDGSVYTMADGTVAYFNTNLQAQSINQANGGMIASLRKPSGEQLVFTYGSISYQAAGMPYSVPGIRLQAVVSNLGWMLKYDYIPSANPTRIGADFGAWLTVAKVTAINTAVEPNYCNPGSNGCTTQYSWPSVSYPVVAAGVAKQVTDAVGRTTKTWKNGVTLPSGLAITVAYDSSNRVGSVSNGSATWTYAYSDSNGIRTTTATDPLGHTRVVVSNLSTLLSTSDTDALGHTTSYAYDSYGRITQVTRPEGDATQYAYDARGNITTVTQVAKPGSGLANTVTSASYDSTCTYPVKCNKPNSTTDARGKVTSYTYDTTMGAVLTVTQPTTVSGTSPQVRYSYAQVPTYSVNSSGVLAQSGTIWTLTQTSTCRTQNSCSGTSDESRTTISYNSATNLFPVSTTVAAGDGSISETASRTFDAVGNVLTTTDSLGNLTRNRYDADREVIGVVSPAASSGLPYRATRYSYSSDGLQTLVEAGTVNSQSDSDWANFSSLQQSATNYDALDRVATQTVTASGSTFALTQTSYDAANRVTCVAQRMNAAAFSSLPASACTAGTAGSDGPDRIVSYGYDNDNRAIQVTSAYGTSAASTVTTSFGSNGETISVVDGKNNLTAYSYDGFNRLIQTNYPSTTSGAGASNSADYQTLSYDAGGNIVSIRRRDGQTVSIAYDNLSRPVNDMTGASYVYDNLGNVTSVAANSQTLSASYDALGRQSYQSGPLGTVSYLYDSLNRRTRMTWPDGFYVSYAYDAVSELTSISDSTGASVATYAYDNLGRRTGITRGNGIGTSYTYDSFSNLTNLAHGSLQSYSLAYNASGQIKSQTSSNDSFAYPASAMNRAYGLNGLNQTTASGSLTVSYDGRGNVSSDGVNTYAYDVANRLTTMSNGTTLSYDPLSRLSKTVGSATTQFLYDGTDLIAEFNGSGNLLRRYIHGPGSDEPVAWYEGSGTANRQWLLANAQGSVIAVTNASGATMAINTYDEYGLPGSGNVGRFQYTGQKWIPEIGMYDYKARIYSPGFGRFLQTDPIGYGDGPNWYAYVHGDPVNGRDPTGTAEDDGEDTEPTTVSFLLSDIIVHGKREASPDDLNTLFEKQNAFTPESLSASGSPPPPKPKPGDCAHTNSDGKCTYRYDKNGKLVLDPEYAKEACASYHAIMKSQSDVSRVTGGPGMVAGGFGSFGGRFALGAFGWALTAENWFMKFAPPWAPPGFEAPLPPGCSP